MDWFRDHAWESWLILAAALATLELVGTELILLMLAGGALVGCVVALLGAPVALQVILGLATSLGLLGLVRPSVVRRMHHGPHLRTGTAALIGQKARVLEQISPTASGRVKIGGEQWAAESYDEDDVIAPGALVDVVEIKGATAYVMRRHELTTPDAALEPGPDPSPGS